jgi:hypothetical protein
MANKGRGSVRQPATKFANLRKKMTQNKIAKGQAGRNDRSGGKKK